LEQCPKATYQMRGNLQDRIKSSIAEVGHMTIGETNNAMYGIMNLLKCRATSRSCTERIKCGLLHQCSVLLTFSQEKFE
jgi:hypothetical protein